MNPQPKPTKRPPKPRQPLRHGKALTAKRWGVHRKLKKSVPNPQAAKVAYPKPTREAKTKHGRRPREWGFMHFCHARGCELDLDRDLQHLLGIKHVCTGPLEFAHLSDKKRYDIGDVGACLCRDAAHRGIDGKVGGKATWYVALGKRGQNLLVRMRLSNRARAAWDALTPAQRAEWDRKAAEQRGKRAP